ncbi:MMPL family transporter, partial [Actinomadura napierensis]|uniref:MMPL family transporter n=1 Tax=Actinomadura napierensis TaxID=267854 RepID=UPI0031E08A26
MGWSAPPFALRGRGRPGRLLGRFGRLCARRRTAVLALAGLATLLLGLAASGLGDHLSNGGYGAAGTQSARADRMLADRFHQRPPDLVLLVEPGHRVTGKKTVRRGRRLTERVGKEPGVAGVRSYWSPHSSDLRSKDGRSALMAITLDGDDGEAARTAERLVPRARDLARPWKVSATGPSWVDVRFSRQGKEDQRRAEIIVVPVTVLILLAAFGSAYAAMLPAVVGAVAVIGTLAVLRLLAGAMAISVLAPNLATAIGFGLAIDYSLFLVTRYREELARGVTVVTAVERSVRTAGRTVLFSAVTVLAALCGLLLFPMPALRSLACAAMTVVGMAAAAALLVVPALLAAIGTRIDRYDPFARWRRAAPAPAVRTGPAGRRRTPLLACGTLLCGLGLAALQLTGLRTTRLPARPA